MNKITKSQFISLLLIEDLFVLFCLSDGITVLTAVAFVVGIVIQAVLVTPLAIVYSKGKSLRDCGKLAEILVLVCVVLWGGMLFSMLWNCGKIIYIPYESSGIWGKLMVTGIIGLLCVYISSSGIKTIGRLSLIVAVLCAVCLLVVITSALIQSDKGNLSIKGERSFITELNRGFSLSGGLGSFMLFLGLSKGKPLNNAISYFSARILLTTAVILTGVLVSGGIMEITEFPIATSAQLSQPFPVQRIDALFLIVFSVSAVCSIALQAASADYILDEISPLKKYRSTIMLAAMVTAGVILS